MSSGSPRWHEVTALFGGRFDPPHLGHRQAVCGLFTQPGIKRVLLLPTPRPAYKPCIASLEARQEMIQKTFTSTPQDPLPKEIQIHPIEIELAHKNPNQPTYTFNTLLALKNEFAPLAVVIGTDQLEVLHTWHRFPDVLGEAHWIVLARKAAGNNQELEAGLQAFQRLVGLGILKTEPGGWIYPRKNTFFSLVSTHAPAISSTQIRETIGKTGEVPENLMYPSVSFYLKQTGLYGTKQMSKELL